MSKLEKLIQELCPDGVEYKKLGEAITIKRGVRVVKSQLTENGKYPVYQNSLTPLGFYEKSNVEENTTFVIVAGAAGEIGYSCVDFWAADDCFYFSCGENILNKYIYYVLMRNKPTLLSKVRKASIPRLSRSAIEQLIIPIPPLPIQREIVRILDNFTELTAELTTELTARKKQYEYYLNQFYGGTYEEMLLLEKRAGWKILSLSGIGTFTRGKRFVKADSEGLEDGVPCIHYGELYTYYGVSAEKSKSFVPVELAQKLRYAHKGDVVIVGAGENNLDIGVGVAWFGEDVVVHDACYIFKHKLNPKYLSYFLRTTIYHNQIKKYVSEGKICSISAQGLGKAIIPVPPMEEQKRIVSILDRFDALCNDLTSGLPAEIEARQKQYEYYRDKLLTFQPLEKGGVQ